MMLRIVAALLAWVLLSAQTPMLPGFPPGTFQNRAALDAAPAGGVTLSLDGSVHTPGTGTNVATLTLSTTKTNNVIYVAIEANGSVASVVGSTLGAFTARATGAIVSFWALAPSILSSEVITLTYSGGTTFISATAFAVNGAHTAAPFDVNASIPTISSFGVPADPLSATTTAVNTMAIGAFRMSGTSNPTNGSGWTPIQLNGDFLLTEVKLLSSAGSFSATIGTGVGDSNQGIVDAIVQGP